MPRPYRAWGYPYTTTIALAGSILFLIGSIATDRDNAPLAVFMLLASYPVYRAVKYAATRTAIPRLSSSSFSWFTVYVP